ncbi:MAG: hypothetical protein SOW13_05755, partial [Sodaliphilus sp.]|nr:hypothetical protein [Sodaliphilus sp.]
LIKRQAKFILLKLRNTTSPNDRFGFKSVILLDFMPCGLKNVRLLLSFFINFSTFAPLNEKGNNDDEQENGDYSSVPFGYVCDDGTEYHR